MAMVNMNNLLNGKDSRWLQLEVCREFQRNKCSRQDTECKFAHPPANVEVQNGKVTACYDSIKGRCNRDKPPCKYFHPPQHLKDQLLINGRNHLALKNALMQQMGIGPGQPVIPGQVPTVATNPYLTGIPANTYNPYFAPGHLMPTILGPDPSGVSQLGPVVPQAVPVAQQKIARSDRLEMDVKTVGSFYYENFAFSGMVPYKRPAAEKSGIPVYQPGATTYQQLMQLQQPFVPVSSSSKVPLNASYVIYTDTNGQLLDTLPVCQDFNRSMCSRLNCRFVHLTEDDKVEVCDQRVAVCRDHANGQCRRKLCKYYHIPIVLPPANIMATIYKSNQQPLSLSLLSSASSTSSSSSTSLSTPTSLPSSSSSSTSISTASKLSKLIKSPILTTTAAAKIITNTTAATTTNINNQLTTTGTSSNNLKNFHKFINNNNPNLSDYNFLYNNEKNFKISQHLQLQQQQHEIEQLLLSSSMAATTYLPSFADASNLADIQTATINAPLQHHQSIAINQFVFNQQQQQQQANLTNSQLSLTPLNSAQLSSKLLTSPTPTAIIPAQQHPTLLSSSTTIPTFYKNLLKTTTTGNHNNNYEMHYFNAIDKNNEFNSNSNSNSNCLPILTVDTSKSSITASPIIYANEVNLENNIVDLANVIGGNNNNNHHHNHHHHHHQINRNTLTISTVNQQSQQSQQQQNAIIPPPPTTTPTTNTTTA